MTMKTMSRVLTAAAAVALTGSALLVPATAQAVEATTVHLAEDNATSTCVITSGDLSWGVRESFRSYISGIANGAWEVSEGATYETPKFGWTNPVGQIDADTGEGTASFAGLIHFTGHDGALTLKLANPTIEFVGDGTARLLLDSTSQRATGELAIDEEQAYIGKIEGIGDIDPASGAISFVDASVVLTSDGASAFGDFYASGEALDPITLNLQLEPCAAAEGGAAGSDDSGEVTTQDTATPISEEATGQNVPWLPIALGGVAVIVIAVASALLITGRKKNPASAPDDTPTPQA